MDELYRVKTTHTGPQIRGRIWGRPPKIEWTSERLEKLRHLICAGAGHDDLQAAFGTGLSTILVGARILIQEMSAKPVVDEDSDQKP
jgi:hypothetical protein